MTFLKKNHSDIKYDSAHMTPVIRCSICTGEKVAGFRDNATGKFTDVMLIKSSQDLEAFRKKYGIKGEIEKIY
ncbi:MAG: aspartate dehydrogenase [Clostridia bacterium]|nr:aspartate dehydrogenase [Clostridia bacterium]